MKLSDKICLFIGAVLFIAGISVGVVAISHCISREFQRYERIAEYDSRKRLEEEKQKIKTRDLCIITLKQLNSVYKYHQGEKLPDICDIEYSVKAYSSCDYTFDNSNLYCRNHKVRIDRKTGHLSGAGFGLYQ
ncbi:MAG: hypothetical protein E7040_12965 [Lentisphaerae bacterium]|nr:hypothetical protein [Lentisphaerota bacterium]